MFSCGGPPPMGDTRTRNGGAGVAGDAALPDAEAVARSEASATARSSSSHRKRFSSHQPVSLSVRARCHPTPTRLRTAFATAFTARSLPMEYEPTRNSVRGSLRSSLRAISAIAAHARLRSGKRQRGSQ